MHAEMEATLEGVLLVVVSTSIRMTHTHTHSTAQYIDLELIGRGSSYMHYQACTVDYSQTWKMRPHEGLGQKGPLSEVSSIPRSHVLQQEMQ